MNLIAIVLTALLSGLSATAFTAYLNDSNSRWHLHRTQIEKLFNDISRIRSHSNALRPLISEWFSVGNVVKTNQDWLQFCDKNDQMLADVSLTVHLYFPEYKKRIIEIMEIDSKLHGIFSEIFQIKGDGKESRQDSFQKLQNLFIDRSALMTGFMYEAGKTGRAIVTEPTPLEARWNTVREWLLNQLNALRR